MRVALLSCSPLPEPDHDEQPLVAALERRGASVSVLPWDDSSVDWGHFDHVVVRATWDYHLQVDAFLTTLAAIDLVSRLHNPLPVIRWNVHKRYLHALDAGGVGVIPTRLLRRGATAWPPLPSPAVIKPAVSGSSWETRRLDGPSAERFLTASVAARDTLVQPDVPGFVDPGEHSLVYIGGALSHAVVKQPRFAGDDESVRALASPPPAARAVADASVALLPAPCAFTRVDLVPFDGAWVVSELEAIEPSLFLPTHGPAADRLAACILRG